MPIFDLVNLPIEFLLLSSSETELLSPRKPLILFVGVAILAVLDNLLSRSISDLRGLFGVSSSVSSTTKLLVGVVKLLLPLLQIDVVSFSGGVAVIGVRVPVYHWLVVTFSDSRSICNNIREIFPNKSPFSSTQFSKKKKIKKKKKKQNPYFTTRSSLIGRFLFSFLWICRRS